jgi:hypothetical protein
VKNLVLPPCRRRRKPVFTMVKNIGSRYARVVEASF